MADQIDDVIRDIADAERKVARTFSFSAMYSFVANAVHIARGQERQAILDEVTKVRPGDDASSEAREAHDAAISAVIRVIVGRSMTD